MIGVMERIRRGNADAAEAIAVAQDRQMGNVPERLRCNPDRLTRARMDDLLCTFRAVAAADLARNVIAYGITPEHLRAVHTAYRAADVGYVDRFEAEIRAEIEALTAPRPVQAPPVRASIERAPVTDAHVWDSMLSLILEAMA
jgi:hypothetical protein